MGHAAAARFVLILLVSRSIANAPPPLPPRGPLLRALPSLTPPLDGALLRSWSVGGAATVFAATETIALLGETRAVGAERALQRGHVVLQREIALSGSGWLADLTLRLPRACGESPRIALIVQRRGSAPWASSAASFERWLASAEDPIESALQHRAAARSGELGVVVALRGHHIDVVSSGAAANFSSPPRSRTAAPYGGGASPPHAPRCDGARNDVWVRIVRRGERIVARRRRRTQLRRLGAMLLGLRRDGHANGVPSLLLRARSEALLRLRERRRERRGVRRRRALHLLLRHRRELLVHRCVLVDLRPKRIDHVKLLVACRHERQKK